MSVETPEQEEDVKDLEQVTPITPPAKRTRPAPKRKANPPRRQSKSADDIRAEIEADLAKEAELRARIEAEVRAKYEAEYASKAAKADASVEGIDETPYVHVVPAPGEEVIHFVEDGMTFGNKVYMRGEELALKPEQHPWIKYTRGQQIRQYGKALFAQGPWPYGGYDLTDENLTEQDKQRLLRLTENIG